MREVTCHDVGDELDRLCELANVGAGHAASALARLVGRPIRMAVPRLRMGSASGPSGATGAWIFFDVEGGIGGALVVRLAHPVAGTLAEQLVGHETGAQAESALREVGNILASHALSAVADLLGAARVLPSPPSLVFDAAGPALAAWRSRAAGRVCIETSLHDDRGLAHVDLVWIPDGSGFAAPAPF